MSQDLNDEKVPAMRTGRLIPFPERLWVWGRQKAGRREKWWGDEVTEAGGTPKPVGHSGEFQFDPAMQMEVFKVIS